MARKISKPRYIKPESITIGDVIRYTVKIGDLEMSYVGKVASREYLRDERHIQTADGRTILAWHPARKLSGTITLLEPAATLEQIPLEGIEL